MALDGAHHRKLWFVTLAQRVHTSPIRLSVGSAACLLLLTPLTLQVAGPIQYVRRDFEHWVPVMMAATLVVFVVILTWAERWAAEALAAIRPFLDDDTDVDPARHPPAASWAGALTALALFVPVHEINTSRWTRFLSGDWNLFDGWAVLLVALALVVSFQASYAIFFLTRRLGSLGARMSVDLFDRSRGKPLVRFALRLALLNALTAVFLGLSAVTEVWAYGPGLFGACVNFSFSVLLLAVSTVPFVRSMQRTKRAELLRVNAAIVGDPDALDASPLAGRLRELNLVELLAYRREVAEAQSWPLDAALWGRWVFYLVLPPLSWVAAALVEQVVQGTLTG